MAEIRQTFTADDSGLLGALKAIRASAEANAKAFDEMSDGQKKLSAETQKALDESNKALDDSIDILGKKTKATEEDKKATTKWKEEVAKAAGEVNILGVNLGGAIDKLKEKKKSLDNVVKGLGATGTASKRLGTIIKTTLISTGFGALIVVLGSLVTYFTKTQRGLDRLNIAFAGIRSVIDNVIDRVALVGEGFASIFSGKVKQGINQIKNSFKGLGEEIGNDIENATELERRSQELIKVQRALTVEEAKRRTEIEKLREESRKQGISQEEAIEKLEKAGRLEDQLAAKRQAAAREEYEIIKQRNELADSKNADLDAEAEALARLESIEGERARNNRRLLSELQSLRNKSASENAAAAKAREDQLAAEAKQIKMLKDAYIDMIGTIEDKLKQQKLEQLQGRERLIFERQLALEEIDLLEQKAKAAALAAGEEYNLAEKFLIIRQNINDSYSQQAKELAKVEAEVAKLGGSIDSTADAIFEKLGRQSTPFGIDPGQAREAGEKNLENIAEGMRRGVEINKDVFEEIKITMMSWLGITGEDMAILEQSAATAFDTLSQMHSAHIDQQIRENERLLDVLKHQTEVVQSELEHQMELQAQGRSNNVESKRQELKDLQQAEAEALRERQRLEQQQMRAQLAADAARQISNMVTGVTSLLAAEASKGIVGVGIAALAIPTFLALFRAAQSQARAAVGIGQRAYKGGPMGDYLGGRRSGFVDRGGRSDIPGRGDGYRVQGTDLVIGGDEFLMNERTSRKQERFMGLMNSGALDGYNLYEFFNPRPPVDVFNRVAEGGFRAARRTQMRKERAMIDASVSLYLKRLVELTEGQKQRMSLADYNEGYVEIDSKGNKRIIRK